MNHSILLILVLLIPISSCHKDAILDAGLNHKTNGMCLDFISIQNSFEAIDTTTITSSFNSEKGIEVNAASQEFNHFGIELENVENDSIYLFSSFEYDVSNNIDFMYRKFELGFLYKEAKDNITTNADGFLQYKDLNNLLQILRKHKWDNNQFREQVNALAFIRIPDSYNEWTNDQYSSNGFYFEQEKFQFNELNYNENEFSMSGNFDVQLKILSCGYWTFYELRNASFQTNIKI